MPTISIWPTFRFLGDIFFLHKNFDFWLNFYFIPTFLFFPKILTYNVSLTIKNYKYGKKVWNWSFPIAVWSLELSSLQMKIRVCFFQTICEILSFVLTLRHTSTQPRLTVILFFNQNLEHNFKHHFDKNFDFLQ